MPITTGTVGLNADVNALIGRIDGPVYMYIEDESNLLNTAKNRYDKKIYNVRTSKHNTENWILSNGGDLLSATAEGGSGKELEYKEVGRSEVRHIIFKGDCTINRALIEDSNMNEISRAARTLTRAYYNTLNRFATHGLVKATGAAMDFAGEKGISLVTYDGKPLFAKDHLYNNGNKHQSNYYYYSIGNNAVGSEMIEEILTAGAILGRNLKDENGSSQGYQFNKLFIPGNRIALEKATRKAIGTVYQPGSANNDINIQAGGWNFEALPYWESDEDEIILISDSANEALDGSVYWHRTGFECHRIGEGFDKNDNLIYHGRSRMSLKHNTYKHAIRIKLGSAASDAKCTTLTL